MPKGAVPFPFGKCGVCNDQATGVHYGAETCEGCKGFFKRSLLKAEKYTCTTNGNCSIGPDNRIKCKFCRFRRCVAIGMSMDAIKMGRIPKAEKQKALISTSFPGSTSINEETEMKMSPDSNSGASSAVGAMLTRQHSLSNSTRSETSNVSKSASPNASHSPLNAAVVFPTRMMQQQTPKMEQITTSSFNQIHRNSNILPSPPQPKIRKANSLEFILPDEGMAPTLPHLNQFNHQYHQKRSWVSGGHHNGCQPTHTHMAGTDNHAQSESGESRMSPDSFLNDELGRLINTTVTIKDSPTPPTSLSTQHQHDPARSNVFGYPQQHHHLSKYTRTGGDLINSFQFQNQAMSKQPQRQNSLHCPPSEQNYLHPKFEVRSSWPSGTRAAQSPPKPTRPLYHSATSRPVDLLTFGNNSQTSEDVARNNYAHMEAEPSFSRTNTEVNQQQQGYAANVYQNHHTPSEEHDSDYNSVEGSIGHSPAEANQNNSVNEVMEDDNLIQQVAQSYRNSTRSVQNGIEVMNKILTGEIEKHNKTLPYCRENMPLIWSWLMESVTEYNKLMMNFMKNCPHVKLFSSEDQIALIKHGYLSLWLIWNAPLFHNGETYIPFENDFIYTRAWMENILPSDFVQYLYDYTARQNRNRFTIDELALLSLLAVTPHDVCGLQRPDLVRNVHQKYRTILEIQFKKTRLNYNEFLKEIDPMLETLSVARKRQEIILSFSPDNPPEVKFAS